MGTAKIDMVIRQLRRAMLRQVAVGKTDGQLLASFIEQKDEAAFEALVHRHGPMIFGVCRRVVGNHHDAEDAFQATFLVLALKASTVRPSERVANWLHGVALRTAMKVKATTTKRRRREKQVTEMPEPEAVQQEQWRDLQPLLDQELNGLPENYRLPILLCDLEGKTIKEAAQQLGWPQGTLASRLARGRKLLAKRLANRGVAQSAGSLAVIVSQNVASAGVPTSLMSSTVKAATMIAAGQAAVAGVVPAQVAALTEGVMKAMLLTKLKTVWAIMFVVGITAIPAAGLAYRAMAGESNQTEERTVPSNPPAKDHEDGRRAEKKPDLRLLRVEVERLRAENEELQKRLQQQVRKGKNGEAKLVAKVYPVVYPVSGSDERMIENEEEVVALIRVIKKTIEPTSWSDMGGDGSIEYLNFTGSIVIRQTSDIHKQVQELLDALWKSIMDQDH
jgi:RNA polymerase sigma factor (sigma-70 family)